MILFSLSILVLTLGISEEKITLYFITCRDKTIECKQFRFDYTAYPSIDGQLKFHVIPAKWKDARLICDLEGAVLASPGNDSMIEALNSEMAKMETPHGIYIGVNSIDSKGYFYSIEGESLEDMPLEWLPGEPNNVGNNEDCIAYGNGKVADVGCSELLPFVCYRKGVEAAKPKCRPIEAGSERCYWFHPDPTTWPEAQRACLAEGGHLAVINSKEEAESIKDFVSSLNLSKNVNVIYIGFRDWSERGNWKTIHGQSLKEAGYAEWSQEPSSGSDSYCGAMDAEDAKLVNYWCSDTRVLAPSLCERA